MALIRRDTQILTAMVKKKFKPVPRTGRVHASNSGDAYEYDRRRPCPVCARAGDRQAFCNLLERCYDRIFGLAFRLTGNRTEAEDLTPGHLRKPTKKAANLSGKGAVFHLDLPGDCERSP